MCLSYADCRHRFGSPYQIDKVVADGRLQKIEAGVYSDGGRVSELGAIQFKYPKGVIAFESARANWLQIDPVNATERIMRFLESL